MGRVADPGVVGSAKLASRAGDSAAKLASRAGDSPAKLASRLLAQLARSEEVHQALVSVVLEGGDLGELAAEVASIIGHPVLVTTPDGRVVAQAGEVPGSAHFDRSGRFRVESVGKGRVSGLHCAVVPIAAGKVDHGRLVTFAPEPVDEDDVKILERAAPIAALVVTKGLAVAAVEDKYRADFLRDLLTGRAGDIASAVAHARTLGWDVDRRMVVAVAELDPGQVPASLSGLQLRPVQERFASAWQTVLRSRDPRAPVASFNREVVVVLAAPEQGGVGPLAAELERQVAGDRGGGRLTFSLGLSRVVAQAGELARAYEQARTAVRIGRRLHGPGARACFDQLGAYRLLALVPDDGELRAYVADVLGDLAAPTPDAADLRRTLEVLLDANGNVAEAARTLHFHYNTLRYRIEKLERMVGPFTTNPSLRLDLSLALRVRTLRDREEP